MKIDVSKLRSIRLRKGYSQQELARRVGVAQPRISEVERGKCVPRLGTLYRITKVLGVKMDDVLVDDRILRVEDNTKKGGTL